MRIGIAFDLKPAGPLPAGAPDDLHEEFDAPVTIRAIADVLRGLGHQVRELGDGRPFLEAVLRDPPELVFNFADTCDGQGNCVDRGQDSCFPYRCDGGGCFIDGRTADAHQNPSRKRQAKLYSINRLIHRLLLHYAAIPNCGPWRIFH